MKTKPRLNRPPFYDEAWLRAEVDEVLKLHPLYGHRMCTRARHIVLDEIMDDLYLQLEAERLVPRTGIDPVSTA